MGKKLIEGSDFVVRMLDLHTAAVDGCVVSNSDGCHTIILNKAVCRERQQNALKHELDHIQNDDLYSDDPVSEIEGRI